MQSIDLAPAGSIEPVNLRELAKILVKHFNLREGWFECSVNFKFAVGGVGPDDDKTVGAIVALGGVGLAPSAAGTPNAVNAADINRG